MKQPYITAIDANKNKNRCTVKVNTITPSLSKNVSSMFSAEPPYVVADTTAELFSEVAKTIGSITNETVQKQASNTITQLYHSLQKAGLTSRKFQKLSASQSEDGSCLIEWHFTKFHIGFSLEPCEEDSYYFLVSMDESIGEMETRTRRINGNLDKVVNDIIRFIINNA
jgi:hypothetical protein